MTGTNAESRVEFEHAPAVDILSGLETLRGRSGQGTIIPAPGNGPDEPLQWAVKEVGDAAFTTDKQEQSHLCSNALINSRRALACLVDWYLERDLAIFCKNPPAAPKRKADFLTRRGIIDDLTSRVLARAINERNKVEHQYVAPQLSTAEDVVELIRRTISAIRNHSDPSLAPWIYGVMLYSSGHGDHGLFAEFHGWSDQLTVFLRFSPRPWVGLVLPDGHGKALVRRAFLDETTEEELAQLLSLAERKYGRVSSFSGEPSCKLLAREAGLL